MPSARRSRRISAQSSTPNTPLPPQLDNEPGSSRVVSFRLPEGGQFSRAVDTVEREIDATLARQFAACRTGELPATLIGQGGEAALHARCRDRMMKRSASGGHL
jgi:hypothetical protein